VLFWGYTAVPFYPVVSTYYAHLVLRQNGQTKNIYTAYNVTITLSVSLSTDGRWATALLVDPYHSWVLVYDTVRGSFVLNATAGSFSNAQGFCVSSDGAYIGVGMMQLYAWARQSDGSYIQIVNGMNLPVTGDYLLGACAISTSGIWGTAFEQYATYTQTAAALWQLNATGAYLKGVFQSSVETSGLQDAIAVSAITADGTAWAYSSWGSASHSPTVRLFSTASKSSKLEPVWEFTTPGSVFWIDVARVSTSQVAVLSVTKSIHANIAGRGGSEFFSLVNA